MATILGTAPTLGPSRGDPETSGSVAGSSRRRRCQRLAVDVADRTGEVADLAVTIEEAGFFLTGRAVAQELHRDVSCGPSEREAAVDQMDRTGGERGFVRGEVDRQRRYLLGIAEPAQRLALDKGAARR